MQSFRFLLTFVKKNRGFTKFGGDVDDQDLREIWIKQKGICPFTGVKLIVPTWSNYKVNSIFRASVDRKDNTKGYTKDNIQFVSQMYNFAKNTNTHENVLRFCNLVTEKNKNE